MVFRNNTMTKIVTRYLVNLIYSNRQLRGIVQRFFAKYPFVKAKLTGIRDKAYVPSKILNEGVPKSNTLYEEIREEIESRKRRLLKRNNE